MKRGGGSCEVWIAEAGLVFSCAESISGESRGSSQTGAKLNPADSRARRDALRLLTAHAGLVSVECQGRGSEAQTECAQVSESRQSRSEALRAGLRVGARKLRGGENRLSGAPHPLPGCFALASDLVRTGSGLVRAGVRPASTGSELLRARLRVAAERARGYCATPSESVRVGSRVGAR